MRGVIMKKIVLNEGNLMDDEIEFKRYKARALIIDDNNVVTLCNYGEVRLIVGRMLKRDY